jgi:hypothetical protein
VVSDIRRRLSLRHGAGRLLLLSEEKEDVLDGRHGGGQPKNRHQRLDGEG